MTKYSRYQLLSAIAVTLLSFASPVALTRNSWALSCNDLPPNIQEKIDNFRVLVETASPHTINDLVTALHDPNPCVSVSAADALRSIGAGAEDAIHELISIVENKNQNLDLRRTAIFALRSIDASPALDSLIKVLKDKTDDYGVRVNAAGALQSLENNAKQAIPVLIDTLANDWYSEVRMSAITTLGKIKTDSNNTEVVLALNDRLKQDPSWHVRHQAAIVLGKIAEANKQTTDSKLRYAIKQSVPYLRESLKNKNYTFRAYTTEALGNIGTGAKDAIPDLIQALKDSNKYVREGAVAALGQIGVASLIAAPEITRLLLEDDVSSVKAAAAEALGKIGAYDNNSIESLIKAINDADKSVREAAISSLREIATTQTQRITASTVEAKKTPESSEKDLTQKKAIEQSGKVELEEIAQTVDTKKAQEYLQKAITQMKALEQSENVDADEKEKIEFAINDMEQHLQLIKSIDGKLWWNGIWQFLTRPFDSDSILGIFISLLDIIFIFVFIQILIHIIYLFIWLFHPLGLLVIDRVLKLTSIPLPMGIKIGLKPIFFPVYNSKVLNIWVDQHIQSVREKFPQKTTVQDRQIYVPISVMLDNCPVKQLTGERLRSTFDQYKCLLIWGEGGSGKTSLACQIAQWAMSDKESDRLQKHKMLPVLIQDDLDISQADALFHAIQGQLQDLIGDSDSISNELLKHLLRKKRILVIVDSFSEMKEETRRLICPESPGFGIGALIITSRIEETLGHVTKGVLKPLHIRGAGLSSFLDTYLKLQHKRDRLSDQEFFDDCKQLLSSMKEQEPEFTAMLVKLYGERLIDAKTKGESQIISSIPQLMLDYLNKLNENIKENSLKNEDIQEDAKAIAWECLKGNYRPTTAKKKNVIDALIQLDSHQKESSAKKLAVDFRLNYLENSLGLIRTIEPAEDEIHFDLNVLAEYLAALHLLENTAFLPADKHQSLLVKLFAGADILHRNGQFNHEQSDNEWDKLHQKIKTIPDSFLIALQSCYSYLVQKNEQQPELVIKVLEQIDKELKQRK